MEEQLTGGGAGVDALVEALEFDALVLHRLDGFDQLLHRATQAGELPDDQRVAGAHEGERLRQSGARSLGATSLVLEDALALSFLECVPLQFQLLILCTNARIAYQHDCLRLGVSNLVKLYHSETLIKRRENRQDAESNPIAYEGVGELSLKRTILRRST